MRTARPLHPVFRSAVLGLALGFGVTAPLFAQAADDDSPAVTAACLKNAEETVDALEHAATFARIPAASIDADAQKARDDYRRAGVAPPEDRIRAAEKHAHLISANAMVNELAQMDFGWEAADIRNEAKEIRLNYAGAETPLDPALEQKITGSVRHAHLAAAAAELQELETFDSEAYPDVITQEEQDIIAHFHDAGRPADDALQTRIHAAALHAYKISGQDSLMKLKGFKKWTFADDLETTEKMVRDNFRLGGIVVDAGTEADIRAAMTAGHRTVAQSILAWMEDSYPSLSREQLQREERELRRNFAIGGVAIDEKLETRIHAALFHASRRWIPRRTGAAP